MNKEKPLEFHAQRYLDAKQERKGAMKEMNNVRKLFHKRTGDMKEEHILSFLEKKV